MNGFVPIYHMEKGNGGMLMSSVSNALNIVKNSPLDERLKSADEILQEFKTSLLDPASGMDEEQQKQYEKKIIAKLKSGKRLTPREMSYLRAHNPQMYEIARRVELARQALRERLKHCKSKEEVQQTISTQMEMVKAMDEAGDPATEYMAAMVDHEAKTFRESEQYQKLPQSTEEARRKKKQEMQKDPFAEKDQEEADSDGEMYSGWSVLFQGQYQCELLGQLALSFV